MGIRFVRQSTALCVRIRPPYYNKQQPAVDKFVLCSFHLMAQLCSPSVISSCVVISLMRPPLRLTRASHPCRRVSWDYFIFSKLALQPQSTVLCSAAYSPRTARADHAQIRRMPMQLAMSPHSSSGAVINLGGFVFGHIPVG